MNDDRFFAEKNTQIKIHDLPSGKLPKAELKKKKQQPGISPTSLVIVLVLIITLFAIAIAYLAYQHWFSDSRLGVPVVSDIGQRLTPTPVTLYASFGSIIRGNKPDVYTIRDTDVLYTLPVGVQVSIDKGWEIIVLLVSGYF